MSKIKINVYRADGVWFGARWIDGEYDGCDALPCDDRANEADAIACAETMPLTANGDRQINRVDDDAVAT